jgi:hypothetical protein
MTAKVAAKPTKGKAKVKIIQKVTKPAPIVGKVFYDYAQSKLGIQYQGKDGAFGPPEYLSRVALRKVKANIVNGNMGFLTGEVVSFNGMGSARVSCKDAVLVSWVGYRFQTNEGLPVNEMATAFIITNDTPYTTPTPIILATGIK